MSIRLKISHTSSKRVQSQTGRSIVIAFTVHSAGTPETRTVDSHGNAVSKETQ